MKPLIKTHLQSPMSMVTLLLSLAISSCSTDKLKNGESANYSGKNDNQWTYEVVHHGCGCNESRKSAAPDFSIDVDTVLRKIDITAKAEQVKQLSTLILRSTPCSTGIALSLNPDSVNKKKDGTITWTLGNDNFDFSSPTYMLSWSKSKELRIEEIIEKTNVDSLKHYLNSIYGVRNRNSTEGLKNIAKTKDQIAKHFESLGLETKRLKHAFTTYTSHSILGKITGKNPHRILVIGAHFDTVPGSPGADDNASGISSLMELARILSKHSFTHSILFVGFDLEEDQLMGSYAFVNEGGIVPQDTIMGYINIDMIGYTKAEDNTQLIPDNFESQFPEAYQFVRDNNFKGDFLVEISSESSRAFSDKFESAVRNSVPDLKFIRIEVPGRGENANDLRFSDHSSFWDAGLPAISLGDGANTRNPHYHSAEDKLVDIDFTFIQKVTKATAAAIVEIAQVEQVETGCRSDLQYRITNSKSNPTSK